MQLQLEQPLEININGVDLCEAHKILRQIAEDYDDKADDIFKSILGVLVMRQLEQAEPGTLEKFLNSIEQQLAIVQRRN